MTLEQLRIFVAVAERQHVTEAARAINITQSAASAAIAALEARYGIKLFNRVGRRIELTDIGKTFLGEAKAVLARSAAAERALNDLAGLKCGSLSIFASQTIANYWLPRRMHQFHELYPGISLRLTVGNTEQVATATHDGAADVGFVEGAIDDPVLSVRSIPGDELVVVVGRDHPWAQRRKLKPEDLAKSKWVLREPGSGTRGVFEGALAKYGIKSGDLQISLELPSNEAVKAAVEAGVSAAALSRLVVDADIRAGRLCSPSLKLASRPFFVLHHKERYSSGAELALFALIGLGPKAKSTKAAAT